MLLLQIPQTEKRVDPDLCVRGMDGLRVADASVMPSITSANKNAPTLMIGESGSAHAAGLAYREHKEIALKLDVNLILTKM